jgi:hypothetical protein
VGDGAANLSSSTQRVSLIELEVNYDFATESFTQTQSQQIDLPFALPGASNNTGNFSLVGTVGAEGGLNLSTDSNYLTLMGYDGPIGTGSPASKTPSELNRVIARVATSNGSVDVSTRLSDATGSPRSVVSTDGTRFYAGVSGGLKYVSSLGATTSTLVASGPAAQTGIVGTTLYHSTWHATSSVGVYSDGSPLPTASVTPSQIVGPLSKAGQFRFFDLDSSVAAPNTGGADTLYVTEDSTSATGGIRKYEWNGSQWVAKGNKVYSAGMSGLSGRVVTDGSGRRRVMLFAVTVGSAENNEFLGLVDTAGFGLDLSGTYKSIKSAGSDYAFRGVDVVPEPASLSLLGIACVRILQRHRR